MRSLPGNLLFFGVHLFWQSCLLIGFSNGLGKVTASESCDNFYKYACGSLGTQFFQNRKDVRKCASFAITGNHVSKSNAVAKMRQYRDRRLDINQQNTTTILQLVKEVESFGNCPLMDPFWNADNYNLTYALHSFANLTGWMPFFTLDIFPMSSASVMLKVDAQNMTNYNYYDLFAQNGHEDVRSALQQLAFFQLEFVINGSKQFSEYSTKYLKLQVNQFLNIEAKIHRMIHDAGVNDLPEFQYDMYGNKLYEKTDHFDKVRFNDLEQLAPLVGSRHFLNSPFVLPEVREFLLTNPVVFIKNKKLLADLNAFYTKLDLQILANYLCINYFRMQMKYTDFNQSKYLDEQTHNVINNLDSKSNNDNAAALQRYFPLITDHLFVQNCVDKKALDEAQKMADQFKISSAFMLRGSRWLSYDAQNRALAKLRDMTINIGAPEVALNITLLDDYYSGLNFFPNDTHRELDRKLLLFGKQIKLRQVVWPKEAAYAAKASYSPDFNTFTIPRSRISTTRVFDSGMPSSAKFASIGMIIGHELWQGFASGLYFDENGDRTNLLSSLEMETFHKLAHCYVNQYSSIKDTSTDKWLNGTSTFSKNLPDHAGLRAAYFAYKMNQIEWYDSSPDTPLTPEQFFFKSYGLLWCGSMSNEKKIEMIRSSPYSLPEYRVNEVLKNMPEFAKAFDCPVGSQMNPQNKCFIW